MGERVGDARSSLGGLCGASPFDMSNRQLCLPDGAYRRSTLKSAIVQLGMRLGSFNTTSAPERTAGRLGVDELPWKVPLQPDLGASKNMVLANSPDFLRPFMKVMMYSAFYQAQPEASNVWRMNIQDEADYQNAYQLGLADPIRKQQNGQLRGSRFGMRFVWKY